MHIKRLAANRHIRLPKKVKKFVISIMPGKHPKDEAIPLGYVIRDILGHALTYKEARKAVGKKYYYVDGRLARDIKTPLGVMDVLEVIATGETYRVVYNEKGILDLIKISKKDASRKIGSIRYKRLVKGGNIMITTHDGRNFVLPYEEGNKYKVGDSILFEIPSQKIIKRLELKPGAFVMIVRGKWAGKVGKVKEIEIIRGLEPNKITIEDENGTEITTLKDYVMVLGEDKPEVKIRE